MALYFGMKMLIFLHLIVTPSGAAPLRSAAAEDLDATNSRPTHSNIVSGASAEMRSAAAKHVDATTSRPTHSDTMHEEQRGVRRRRALMTTQTTTTVGATSSVRTNNATTELPSKAVANETTTASKLFPTIFPYRSADAAVLIESEHHEAIKFAADNIITVTPWKPATITIFTQEHLTKVVMLPMETEPTTEECPSGGPIMSTTPIKGVGYEMKHTFEVDDPYFICVETNHGSRWLKTQIQVETPFIMLIWIQILLIVILLPFSGLFSGLNLGLLTLDISDLQMIAACGTESDKKCVKSVLPVRKHTNWLLCSLLIGNTAVNATIALLQDNSIQALALNNTAVHFVVSVLLPTLLILIFGEIIPQAACCQRALVVAGHTIYITWTIMILTSPISYPISLLLDYAVGENGGETCDKNKIRNYILSNPNESEKRTKLQSMMIEGALTYSQKFVTEAMTPLADCHMLSDQAILTRNVITEIAERGFTRIPVYTGQHRRAVKGILNVKDLVLIGPNTNTSVGTVTQFWNRKPRYVTDETPLRPIYHYLTEECQNMAVVQKFSQTLRRKDPYETTGIITLEDVIEQVLLTDIRDEKDYHSTPEGRANGSKQSTKQHPNLIKEVQQEVPEIPIPNPDAPLQLVNAASIYLSTTLPAFGPHVMPLNVLQQLISVRLYRISQSQRPLAPGKTPYTIHNIGRESQFFVMLLEGGAKVQTEDGTQFEAGPFTLFGADLFDKVASAAATSDDARWWDTVEDSNSFTPNYTLLFTKEDSVIFKISYQTYVKHIKELTRSQTQTGNKEVARRKVIRHNRFPSADGTTS